MKEARTREGRDTKMIRAHDRKREGREKQKKKKNHWKVEKDSRNEGNTTRK